MPTTRRIAIVVALATLVACAKPRIQTDRSTIATFPRYRTFAWASVPQASPPAAYMDASLLDWRIRKAVESQLAAKGYAPAAGDAASLLVDYDVKVPAADGSMFADYFRERPSSWPRDVARSYAGADEAWTLSVALVDARTNEVAYRAAAQAHMPPT